MEELSAKFSEILRENVDLKHKNLDLQFKIANLEQQINMFRVHRDTNSETEDLISLQKKLIEENIQLKLKLSERPIIAEDSHGMPDLTPCEAVEEKNDSGRLKIISEQNVFLKCKLSQAEDDLEKYKTHFKRIFRLIQGLFGYKMVINKDNIELLSIYAFNSDDLFVFKETGDSVQLLENDFVRAWQKEVELYLIKGRSVPGLLSGVTLELFNTKTFN